MMEKRAPLTSPDGSGNTPERCPSSLYSQDSTQEGQDEGLIVVKVEDEEMCEGTNEPSLLSDDWYKKEEIPPEIITDHEDSQREVKAEEEEEEEYVMIKEEEVPTKIDTDGSHYRITPENHTCPLYSQDSAEKDHRIPGGDQNENLIKIELKEEAEELYVKGLEKKIPPEIGTDGRYRVQSKSPMVSLDDEIEVDEVTSGSSEEDLVTPDQYLAFSGEDPSRDPSTHVKGFPKHICSVTHHAARKRKKPFYSSKSDKYLTKKGEHTPPRPEGKTYSCSACDKHFNRRGNLISHQRTHSGEKPFSCSECGKCFAWKVQLVRHQTIHPVMTPLSCPDCGESFTERETLMSHKKTHTTEKPYSCPECGKCFSWKDQLVKHLKLHTGEKPYSCLECDEPQKYHFFFSVPST
ncbi:uncharacterized protein [Pyxicephalus adspersus]|uniref:uncharacterized protein isoform X2 n=1 Tax=Pyxicephalus adspersus TaxID=30357 RepID=UPI003B58CD51